MSGSLTSLVLSSLGPFCAAHTDVAVTMLRVPVAPARLGRPAHDLRHRPRLRQSTAKRAHAGETGRRPSSRTAVDASGFDQSDIRRAAARVRPPYPLGNGAGGGGSPRENLRPAQPRLVPDHARLRYPAVAAGRTAVVSGPLTTPTRMRSTNCRPNARSDEASPLLRSGQRGLRRQTR